MGTFRNILKKFFWKYDMYHRLETSNVIVVLTYRIIQSLIVLYIFGYVLLYSKGYQTTHRGSSIVTTKIKGALVTNFSKYDFQVKENTHLYNRVWDSVGSAIPSSESFAFFVITNVIITPNQTQGKCPEDSGLESSICYNKNTGCPEGWSIYLSNGRYTGRCVDSAKDDGKYVCEVEAWCPVESNVLPLKNSKAVLENAKDYTVMIKNSIYFEEFGPGYRRNNIKHDAAKDYLRTCWYNEKWYPLCPIFSVNELVEMAGERFDDISSMGAAMAITITWHCNLDFNFMKHCIPKYSVRRIDNYDNNASKGWNFRHSYQHELERRTLFKFYGIKFVIEVNVEGSKFSIIPTVINFASGLALMRLVTESISTDIKRPKFIVIYDQKYCEATFICNKIVSAKNLDSHLNNCPYCRNSIQENSISGGSGDNNGISLCPILENEEPAKSVV